MAQGMTGKICTATVFTNVFFCDFVLCIAAYSLGFIIGSMIGSGGVHFFLCLRPRSAAYQGDGYGCSYHMV